MFVQRWRLSEHDVCPNTTFVRTRRLSERNVCPKMTFVRTRRLSEHDVCPNMTFDEQISWNQFSKVTSLVTVLVLIPDLFSILTLVVVCPDYSNFYYPGNQYFFFKNTRVPRYPGTRVVGSDQILLGRAQFSVAVPTSCKASYLSHCLFWKKRRHKKTLIKILINLLLVWKISCQ